MDITKMPSSTYWFVLGLLRAKLNDKDFEYVEHILAESLITTKQDNDKPNQQEEKEYKNAYSRL